MAGLSKQEAVERLLIQAVKLQFSDGDPYAIHLLLISSLRTCLDVIKSKGATDIFERIIKPGQRGHFFRDFYSIASFLKHADQDPDEFLEISPNLPKGNEALTVIVTQCFCDAFGQEITNLIVHAAMFYYIKLNPNIYQIENEYVATLSGLDVNQLGDAIRRLVREGPSFLGLKPGISAISKNGGTPRRTKSRLWMAPSNPLAIEFTNGNEPGVKLKAKGKQK